ncbi:hypothetical protein ACO1O0_006199 [Amphichorda felina]
MGLKEFKTDLAKAESATFDKVLSLHKGDAEGELTFSYVPDNSSNPIQIQVLVQNGVDRDICNFLSSLPQYINARSTQSVADVVSFISKRLTARLDPMAAAEEAMSPDEQDTPSDDGSEVDDFSVCGDFNWSGADDEEPFFETRLGQQGPRQFGLPEMIFSGAVERQRKELLAAKKAGFSVGVFDSSISQLGPISSLSVPVKRLGITDFILEAWDIKPTDHLVLLMRVPEGYPTHDHYFTWSGQQPLIQFQLGKCAEPKPSAKSCREAFMSSDVQDQTRQGEKEDQSRQFLPFHKLRDFPRGLRLKAPKFDISRPLNAEISFYQCKAVWGQNVPMFLPEGPVRVGERLLLVKGALSDAILSESLWSHSSNRSFIVQDGPVKRSSHGVGAADGQATSPVQDHVLGMEDDWMQFRFVQGSPEKERRFSEAVKLVPERDSQKAFPTIFAWHGSSLGNWHGIVSTGLNFDRVDNGRASGNGVYFSNYASTSLGYAAMAHNSIIWPHSELRVANAISMCEIVNQPDKFVSSSPHYVVDNLDWIQCRLLFIRVAPTMDALDEPFPQPPPRPRGGYVPQDPQRALFGSRGRRLEIPWSAVAGGWSQVATGNFTKGTDGNRRRPSTLMGQESEESEFEGIDIDKILSEDPQYDLKRQRLSDSPSGFRPGTLDWDTLPRLPDPTSASSTALRALAREAKEMTKIQNSGDLTSLGWYIDFDKLTNLLHWIVELHSFDQELPLVQDMKKKSCQSVVLELRFGQGYPMSPPFARVIRPRFLSFAHGGGGHVTAGGAICSELLTNTGWSPALSLEKVLLQVRLGLCDTERPARLDLVSSSSSSDYGVLEAAEAYKRAAAAHGWSIPGDFDGVIRDMMK